LCLSNSNKLTDWFDMAGRSKGDLRVSLEVAFDYSVQRLLVVLDGSRAIAQGLLRARFCRA
jgi:hypothetical protein